VAGANLDQKGAGHFDFEACKRKLQEESIIHPEVPCLNSTPVELGAANVQPREAIKRTEATPLTVEMEGALSAELDDLCEYSQRSFSIKVE
jgi:hypothetical protein